MNKKKKPIGGFSMGKIGGIATGAGTIIIALTASWNSIRDLFKDDVVPIPPVEKQTTEFVQATIEIENNNLIDSLRRELEVHQKTSTQTKAISQQQSTSKSKETDEQSQTIAKTTTTQVKQQNTATSSTASKNDLRVGELSFVPLGVLSKEIELRGVITNRSTSSSFKNVSFSIEYYGAKDVLLGTNTYSFHNEVFYANKKHNFSIKVPKIKETQTIKMKCISATITR